MSNVMTSTVDATTGLPGYEAFLVDLAQEMVRAEQEGLPVSLVLLDLDWFSRINKENGTEIGDRILRVLAQSLSDAFAGRSSVYRFGGDALMALLPAVPKEQAFLLAEEARRDFNREREITAEGRKVRLTLSVSVGVAAMPDDGSKETDLLRKANEAVYRAKVTGRNKVCLAREEKMVTKTSYFTQGQLEGLSRLAKREGLNEAVLLREAVDDLLRKYNR